MAGHHVLLTIFPDSLKVDSDVQEAIVVLDITMFRENADQIRADHDRRGIPHDSIDEIIRLDQEWRKAQFDADQIRRELSLIHISEPTRR